MSGGVSIATLVQGGFVFLASQTWAEFGRKLIDKVFVGERTSITASLAYSVILTIFIFTVIWLIHKATAIDYKVKYEDTQKQLQLAATQLRTQKGGSPARPETGSVINNPDVSAIHDPEPL